MGNVLVIILALHVVQEVAFPRGQISYLKLEGEKLRCAAFEAQNGVRQRMSRAGSAPRLPAQQINSR